MWKIYRKLGLFTADLANILVELPEAKTNEKRQTLLGPIHQTRIIC